MRAVITVIGKDMVGILARVSAQCAGHGINVLEVTQSILQDMFAMIMMVDISKSDIPFTQFADELTAIGKEWAFPSMPCMKIFSTLCTPSNGETHWNFGAGDTPARKGTGTLCSTPTIYWKPSP